LSLSVTSYSSLMKAQFLSRDEPCSRRYITLRNAILIPIFCVCLIAALGAVAGVRHVVAMQFAVERDTEYTRLDTAALLFGQYLINNSFHLEV
jgi:hypothetical protein